MDNDQNNEQQKALRFLTFANVTLVSLISLAAFSLSFDSLREIAIRTGAMKPGTAALFPLILDGAIVVFSLSAVRLAITGDHKSERKVKGLVLAVTFASLVLNVFAHSQAGVWGGVIGAIPPLLLFSSFEILLLDFRRRCSPVPARKAARPKKLAGPAPAATPPQPAETTARRSQAKAMAAEGFSQAAIARQLGVSAATIRRYLAGMS